MSVPIGFCLAIFRSEQVEFADLGDALDDSPYVRAEPLGNFLDRDFRVFDNIVKQRRAKRGHVQAHVRQHVRYFHGMREEGFAGEPRLRFVLLSGKIVGAPQQLKVVPGPAAADLVHQFDETEVDASPRGL